MASDHPEENLLDDLLDHNQDNLFEDEANAKKDEEEEEEEEEDKDDHSDISEEEEEGPAKDDSRSDISDDPEDSADNKEHNDTGSGKAEDIKEDQEADKPTDSSKVSSPTTDAVSKPAASKREKIEPPPKSDDDEEDNKQDEDREKKKKGKSYDYATKLNYLFREARFFLVKSNNAENVTLSKVKGVWSTPPTNEARLNQAFKEARNVLLIFSVKESGKFAGVARVASESRRDGPQVSWVLPAGKHR